MMARQDDLRRGPGSSSELWQNVEASLVLEPWPPLSGESFVPSLFLFIYIQNKPAAIL